MPRRTHTYAVDAGFAELNMAISTFAIIFGISQLLLVWNIVRSIKKGEKVGKDPWGGWSLEWAVTSPPPTPSFHEGDYFHTELKEQQGDDNTDEHHETKLESLIKAPFRSMSNLWNKEAKS